MARTKRLEAATAEEPAAKKQRANADAKSDDDSEDDLRFELPTTTKQMASALRDGFRSAATKRRFLTKRGKEYNTANSIMSHVANSHLQQKAGFKPQFKRAFSKWANGLAENRKESRVQALNREYSKIYSNFVTTVKKEWFMNSTTADDPTNVEGGFCKLVVMSRITFCNSTKSLIFKPGSHSRRTEKAAIALFKETYHKVILCFHFNKNSNIFLHFRLGHWGSWNPSWQKSHRLHFVLMTATPPSLCFVPITVLQTKTEGGQMLPGCAMVRICTILCRFPTLRSCSLCTLLCVSTSQ
jgi:hypothetical protein